MFTRKNSIVKNLQKLTLTLTIALLSSQLAYAIEIDPKKCEEASNKCKHAMLPAWQNHEWFGENAEYYATEAANKCSEVEKECLKDANTKGAPKGK
ncbi:MAG: hypothetical protein F9K49_06975 [Caedimonadaceae bacterium]|nr:MAG: hypothetical protein F9K49_06975 [Caedimonadaceae bacterium]